MTATLQGRVGCCVEGCRRTREDGAYVEWICQAHWPKVPKPVRSRHVAAKAVLRRLRKPGADVSGWDAARMEADEAWAACKASFMERPAEDVESFLRTWFAPDPVGVPAEVGPD